MTTASTTWRTTQIIDVLSPLLYISGPQNEQSWPSLVAYEIFTSSLENMGMERSLGRVFYTNGHFDTDNDYLQYVKQYHVGKNNLELAGKSMMYSVRVFNSLSRIRSYNTTYLESRSRDAR